VKKIKQLIKNLKREGGYYNTFLWPYIILFTAFSVIMNMWTMIDFKQGTFKGSLILSNASLFFATIMLAHQVINYQLAKKRNQLKGE
jgi:hypothetical protein